MEELQQVLSEPSPSEGEMHERGRQLEQVRGAVQQLEQQKRAKSNNPDDKLGMFRQQANLVAKKKEQVHLVRVRVRQCPNAPTPRRPDAPTPQRPIAPMPQCPSAPMPQCPKAPMPNFRKPNAQCP